MLIINENIHQESNGKDLIKNIILDTVNIRNVNQISLFNLKRFLLDLIRFSCWTFFYKFSWEFFFFIQRSQMRRNTNIFLFLVKKFKFYMSANPLNHQQLWLNIDNRHSNCVRSEFERESFTRMAQSTRRSWGSRATNDAFYEIINSWSSWWYWSLSRSKCDKKLRVKWLHVNVKNFFSSSTTSC